MAEKSFNPYGSAISRTGLFVYDPTKGVDRALAMGQKAFEQPLQKLEAQRAQDIQYAQDIFDNLGELLDQGELEHNNLLNAEVENLIEETKKNMVSRGKGGGITSLNFNNPNFQTQLQTGIKKIRNGINNSKLLKDQYNDLVTYLNTNKDVVSNQIGIINEAAAKLLDPRNLFTSNNVVNDFTTLKNNAIDEVKYISSMTEGLLDRFTKQTLTYEAVDSRGKNITISGEFNKDIYVTDEMDVIQRDSSGKPELDIERVKALRDSIKEDPMTPPQAVEWLKNDANFEQFKDMISADLIIKERTALEEANLKYREAATAAQNRSNTDGNDKVTRTFPEIKRFSFNNQGYTGIDVGKVDVGNVPVSKLNGEDVLLPIPEITDIGFTVDNKKAFTARIGEREVVISEGIRVSDVFDEKTLEGMDAEVLNAKFDQNTINNIWAKADTKITTSLSTANNNKYLKSVLGISNTPISNNMISQLTENNEANIFSSPVTEENITAKKELLNKIENRNDKTSGFEIEGVYFNLQQIINKTEELSNNINEFEKTKKENTTKEKKEKSKVQNIIDEISSDVSKINEQKNKINKGKTGLFGVNTPYSQGQANLDLQTMLDLFFENIDKKISEAENLGATDDQIKKLKDLKEEINK